VVPRVANGSPVAVGIRVPNASAGAIVGNLTGTQLDTGDPKAMARAVVAWINGHGGLAGHRIEPVFYENCAPLSCDLTVQDQQICSAFTQDHHVIAMVDSTETSVALASCLARAGVASLGGGVAAFDGKDFQSAQGLWSPYLLPTDVAFTQLVRRLDATRWFVAGEKVGLLVNDTPTFRRTAAVTKQVMSSVGRAFADEAYYATGGNDMQAIVLRFKASDIKRIVIVDAGSSALLLFGPAASAQGYYPKVTVTSADVMGTLALIASKQTLDGAAGIGWLPDADAAPNRPRPTATGALCAQIYRAAKVSTAGPLAGAFAATYCDALLFARAAYGKATDLSLGSLRGAVAGLGTSYLPAATFADRFAPGVHAGAATTRDVRYDTSCSCFRYSGGEVPVA
jgi:ABC-type branched-subunit amino acid transport system substrate-binding protein